MIEKKNKGQLAYMSLSINDTQHYNTDIMLGVLFITMPNVIMLSVVMLNVVVLSTLGLTNI